MSRRLLPLLAALALVAGLSAAPVGAEVGAQTGPDEPAYDLARAREVQARAAEEVGPVPTELGEYFADKPARLAHARNDELDLPRILHATVEDLPAMQEQLRSYLARRYRAQSGAAIAAGQPMVFKVPVMMFRVHGDQWQDDSNAESFERMLSGTGTNDTGSVTELYREMSFGNMEVDFDVYGPYDSAVANLPGNQCYYGTEGSPVTGDVLGLGGLGARGMAAEAVPMADPDIDFGQYDNDVDGVVDFLIMLHSGPDAAATGDPCHVWSHYFGPLVSEPVQDPTMATTDTNAAGEPVYVGPVMTVPEVDLQIGVTAHELMHALGEPDYYGTAGTEGTGDWDLGAGGSWSGIPAQTNPVHFNPVMKINFGWVDPTRIDATALDQRLRPRASFPDLLQVPLRVAEAGSDAADMCDKAPVGIPGQNNAFYTEDGDCLVEGFLLEHVSPVAAAFDEEVCAIDPADFDRQLYGSGLMVWHWDFTNYQSLGNNQVMRPMLDIEEFDRRVGSQDLETGVTRAEPLDAFWGDPVGISGATQIALDADAIEGPPDSPWTVTGAPALGAVPAEPTPQWEAVEAPEGTGMVVDLTWDVQTDDWDLYVDKLVDDEWVEVSSSAGGAPQTSEQVVISDFDAGDRFRARAYNWLGPTSPQAEVAVSYDASTLTRFGPAGTRDNDLEVTGWAITDLEAGHRGVAHSLAQPRNAVTLDLVKHDESTVDVSGDFVRVAQDAPEPVVAGEPLTLETVAYNHGGGDVAGVTLALHDVDPAEGGAPIDTATVDLGGYDRREVAFDATLKPGLNELYVTASVPDGVDDVTPGNDVVRTELTASDGGGQVLVVDNDRGWTREQAYEATLNALGVSYDVVAGEPTQAVLDRYDAVVWITTSVSGAQGVLSTAGREAITGFLDDGGKLWMATSRLGAYADPAWLGSYFGIEVSQNLLDSMGELRGTGDGIGDTRTIDVGYLDGRPYWDYGRIAEDVKGTPRTVFVHSERPEDAFVTKVTGEGGFRTVYGLPLAVVEDARERVHLTSEVLDFLGVDPAATAADELEVRFERFQHVQVGQDRPVTVGAVGPDGIDRVELVHRPYGAADWRSLELPAVHDGLYAGVIPGEAIGNNGLEYYVRVTAGGEVVEVDGGPGMPDVASAPYGDPVDDDYCPSTDDGGGSEDGDGGDAGPGKGGGPGNGKGPPDRPGKPATGVATASSDAQAAPASAPGSGDAARMTAAGHTAGGDRSPLIVLALALLAAAATATLRTADPRRR